MSSGNNAQAPKLVNEQVFEDESFQNHTHGNLTIKSAFKTNRVWTDLENLALDALNATGTKLWLRCQIQEARCKGSLGFLLLRQRGQTLQGVLDAKAGLDKSIVKWTGSLPLESVVDIYGTITRAEKPVTSASISTVELAVHKIFCISKPVQGLPFQLKDAYATDNEEQTKINVGQDVKLDNRVLDLRTTTNWSIFTLQSRVCQYFREYLYKEKFLEIHTPKLMSGFAEGGATVFKLQYFNQSACLAQSPQLHKQMAICGGLDRVFEIGPVFRAENSNTHRHLCEFTGLDLEMTIKESYHEVLDVLDKLFRYIFTQLETHCSQLIQEVYKQHPAQPFKLSRETPRITFHQAMELLREAGVEGIPEDVTTKDLSTEMEKKLGELMRHKHDTDFYIVSEYPSALRPFYTMPHPNDPTLSNSFDIFMRGEEIISGAQRVHIKDLLIEKAKLSNIDPDNIKAYLGAMGLGAPPHAGAGVGLERVVMLYLGLGNIRKTSMFPRDPKRLSP